MNQLPLSNELIINEAIINVPVISELKINEHRITALIQKTKLYNTLGSVWSAS